MKGRDRQYMRMAIDQAKKQRERFGLAESDARPPPFVGCVVVTKDGKVVAGYHGEMEPDEHAEFTVMEKKMAHDVLADATVYTTLEPCTDRRPPKKSCADRLIERRVSRVVIGYMDPDDRGQGYQKLVHARISVDVFPQDLLAEILELNRRFIESRKKPTLARYESPHVNMPAAPLNNLSTIARHFQRLKVPRDEVFVKAGCFVNNPDRKCVGPIISVDNLRGVAGVTAEMIAVNATKEKLQLPPYVIEEIPRTKIDGRDRNKAALTAFARLPLDVEDGRITLQVAHTKYSTKIAMRSVRQQLVDALIHRTVRIVGNDGQDEGQATQLPCHLHCDGIVLTGDSKVILAQRGRSVDFEPMQWAASFGESVDWDDDRNGGALHPLNTVRRGLEEELGLAECWLRARIGNATQVTFMELGFQLDSFIYILFSMIELPGIGIEEALDRARNHRTDNEPRAFDFMNFTVEQCVPAIVTGTLGNKEFNYAGRFGLLLASLNKLGTDFVDELARC